MSEETKRIVDTVMDYCEENKISLVIQMRILSKQVIATNTYELLIKYPKIKKKRFLKIIESFGVNIDE